MLRSCSGFSMVETLVAFSILISISSLFITSFMLLTNATLDLEKKGNGISILHEKMAGYLYDGKELISEEVEVKNTRYLIRWTTLPRNIVRACIQWEGGIGHNVSTQCLYGKKG